MNAEERRSGDEQDPLRIYLRYEFITARQLAEVLSSVGEIFEALYWTEAPLYIGTSVSPRFQLHVARCQTGNSITLYFQALLETVRNTEESLRGMGGGLAVASLTARFLIYAFDSGHRALSAARMRSLELMQQEQQVLTEGVSAELTVAQHRNEVEYSNALARIDIEQRILELQSIRGDVEYRRFVQRVVQQTATEDFVAAVNENESLIEKVSVPLLALYEALDHNNILEARINDVTIKPEGSSAPQPEQGGDEGTPKADPGSGNGSEGESPGDSRPPG